MKRSPGINPYIYFSDINDDDDIYGRITRCSCLDPIYDVDAEFSSYRVIVSLPGLPGAAGVVGHRNSAQQRVFITKNG